MMKKKSYNRNNNSRAAANAPVEKKCYFCVNGYTEIDYKDAQLCRRFTSSYGKIAPRRRSGVCSTHQRKLSMSIKRARLMSLLPFIAR